MGEYNILNTLSLLGPFQVLMYPLFLRVYRTTTGYSGMASLMSVEHR